MGRHCEGRGRDGEREFPGAHAEDFHRQRALVSTYSPYPCLVLVLASVEFILLVLKSDLLTFSTLSCAGAAFRLCPAPSPFRPSPAGPRITARSQFRPIDKGTMCVLVHCAAAVPFCGRVLLIVLLETFVILLLLFVFPAGPCSPSS